MWITVCLVFLTITFSCSAQVTNNDANSVTENARTNQEVEWDTTGPPVTVSIKDGRSESENRPRSELISQPQYYSNQWQPFLLPIGRGNNGEINSRYTVGDDTSSYRFLPTFLRRPDSEMNRTYTNPYTQLPNDLKYPFGPMPMPMAPFNPMLFYSHQPSLFSNGNYYETGVRDVLQNSSNPAERPEISATETTALKDTQESIVRSPPFAAVPEALERFNPINIYRNREEFPTAPQPVFLPYPNTLSANDNSLNPVFYPFINSPTYEKERSSEVIESISRGKGVSESEIISNSRDVRKQQYANVLNGSPTDSSSGFVPPLPAPLPFAGYPYGVLPQPIYPPYFSGPVTPVSTVEDPISVVKDGLVQDAVISQPPIPVNNPLSEASTGMLIPSDTLKPKGELPATIETIADRTAPDSKTNEEKIPYEFGYDMNDGKGTDQHRKEVSDVSGTVRGSYGYRDVFGVYRIVNYIADKNGFRAFIKSNEPGVASSGSANVVVLAEQPPVQTIAEGEKLSEPKPVITPETVTDLVAEGSETKTV